jgi:predicted nucleotidyltransferase
MAKLIELQSKLAKILAERVDVNHKHGLDEATTEMLLEMKKEVENRHKRLANNTKVITVESVEDK